VESSSNKTNGMCTKSAVGVQVLMRLAILPTARIVYWFCVKLRNVWRILTLRMEEGLPIWRVAANILTKQPRTAGKGWFSSLGVGRGAKNSSP
jgi:hypothetical protein